MGLCCGLALVHRQVGGGGWRSCQPDLVDSLAFCLCAGVGPWSGPVGGCVLWAVVSNALLTLSDATSYDMIKLASSSYVFEK